MRKHGDRWWNWGGTISGVTIFVINVAPVSDRVRLHVVIPVLMFMMFDLGRRYGRWRVEHPALRPTPPVTESP